MINSILIGIFNFVWYKQRNSISIRLSVVSHNQMYWHFVRSIYRFADLNDIYYNIHFHCHCNGFSTKISVFFLFFSLFTALIASSPADSETKYFNVGYALTLKYWKLFVPKDEVAAKIIAKQPSQ